MAINEGNAQEVGLQPFDLRGRGGLSAELSVGTAKELLYQLRQVNLLEQGDRLFPVDSGRNTALYPAHKTGRLISQSWLRKAEKEHPKRENALKHHQASYTC